MITPKESFTARFLIGHVASLLKAAIYSYAIYNVLLYDFPLAVILPTSLVFPVLHLITVSTFLITYLHQRTKLLEGASNLIEKVPLLFSPSRWNYMIGFQKVLQIE